VGNDDSIYNCISNMVQYRKIIEKIMVKIEIQAVFIYVQLTGELSSIVLK